MKLFLNIWATIFLVFLELLPSITIHSVFSYDDIFIVIWHTPKFLTHESSDFCLLKAFLFTNSLALKFYEYFSLNRETSKYKIHNFCNLYLFLLIYENSLNTSIGNA